MKFLLKAGAAHVPDAKNPSHDGLGNFLVKKGSKKPVIIETDTDLCEKFGTTKFERLDGPSEAHQDRDAELSDKKVFDRPAPTDKANSLKGGAGDDELLGQKATRGKAAKKAEAAEEPEDEPVIAGDEPEAAADENDNEVAVDEVEEEVDYGKDVSKSFATQIGPKHKSKIIVKANGADHYVFDAADQSKPLNSDPLTKAKVGGFIADFKKDGTK